MADKVKVEYQGMAFTVRLLPGDEFGPQVSENPHSCWEVTRGPYRAVIKIDANDRVAGTKVRQSEAHILHIGRKDLQEIINEAMNLGLTA
jgi:hypothetical protein